MFQWHDVGEGSWLNQYRCMESMSLSWNNGKENRGTRLTVQADGKEASQGTNSFGCSQQEASFPSSVKSWNILTIYYALHSNTPLQLNPNITSSLIFTRTL